MHRAIILEPKLSQRKEYHRLFAQLEVPVELLSCYSDYTTTSEAVTYSKPDLLLVNPDALNDRELTALVELSVGMGITCWITSDQPDPMTMHPCFTHAAFIPTPATVEELQMGIQSLAIFSRLTIKDQFEKYCSRMKSFKLLQVALPQPQGLIFVDPMKIIRIQSGKKGCSVFIEGGESLFVNYSLKKMRSILRGNSFVRMDKVNMINLNQCVALGRGRSPKLVLSDGSKWRPLPALVTKVKQKLGELPAA